MKALVYLGALQDRKKEIIEVFDKYDLEAIFIDDTCLNETINTLFINGNSEDIWKQYHFNFIMFYEQDQELLKNFYEETKQMGYVFTHKAVLTEHNQFWTLKELLNEIMQEHEFFQSWEMLMSLLRAFDNEKKVKYGDAYADAIMQAYVYTKTQKPKKKELDAFIHKIEASMIEM